MHLIFLFDLFLLIPTAFSKTEYFDLDFPKPQACAEVRTRREWRTLDRSQQTTYLNCILKLQQREGKTTPSNYDMLAKIHGDFSEPHHSHPIFFPWHRWFVLKFEIMLRMVCHDDNIAIPYWKWEYDSQLPHLASVWGDELYGTNGKGKKRCVKDGKFKDWRPMYYKDYDEDELEPRCMRRDWAITIPNKKKEDDDDDEEEEEEEEEERISKENEMGAFYSIEAINAVMAKSKEYEEFRTGIEVIPHAVVHNNIGGDMRSMYSPNDPIFFLHHANLDKIWADWQALSPSNLMAYGGLNHPAPDEDDETTPKIPAKLSDSIYGTKRWKVKDIMDIKTLCYKYEELKTNDLKDNVLPPPKVNITDAKLEEIKAAKEDIAKDRQEESKSKLVRRSDKKQEAVVVPANQKVKAVKVSDSLEAAPPAKLAPVNKLIIPPTVPDDWLAQNGADPIRARKREVVLNSVVEKLNCVPGYVSPVVPWNNPKLMVDMMKNGAKNISVIVNGTLVTANVTEANPKQAAANAKELIKTSIVSDAVQVSPAKIASQVVNVIGALTANKDSASNPFTARHPGEKALGKADVPPPTKNESMTAMINKVTDKQVAEKEDKAHQSKAEAATIIAMNGTQKEIVYKPTADDATSGKPPAANAPSNMPAAASGLPKPAAGNAAPGKPPVANTPPNTPAATNEPSTKPAATAGPPSNPPVANGPSAKPPVANGPPNAPAATNGPQNSPPVANAPSNTPQVAGGAPGRAIVTNQPFNQPIVGNGPPGNPAVVRGLPDKPAAADGPPAARGRGKGTAPSAASV